MQRITLAEIEEMRTRGYDSATVRQALAWLEVCKQADAIILQINHAFDGVTLGDGMGLLESAGLDDYCSPERLKELRVKDEKLDWRKIPVDALAHCNAAPSFLDARGLYFHTPAFLTAELRGEYHYDFISRLIYDSFLAPDFRKYLTSEQRTAIIACINFYGAIEDYSYDPKDISAAVMRYS